MDKNAAGDDSTTSRVRQTSESSDEKCGKRQKTFSNVEDGYTSQSLVSNTSTHWQNTAITNNAEDGYTGHPLGLNNASPPKFILLEEVMNTAKELTNMALANQIALNKDFKLEKQNLPEDSVEKRVKDMLHKAYWDILAQEINETPPNYTRAFMLLAEMKETLLSLLLPRHNRLKEDLNENLDIELIKQQAEHGSLDFHKYAKYILTLMGRICAPVRDERIRELSKLTDIVEILKGIMETLQEMKIDMVNFTVQAVRPTIVEYQKEQFKKFLDNNAFSEIEDKLAVTKEWLKRTADLNQPKQTKKDILNNAFIELLKDDFNIVPETMIIHMAQFIEIRNKCKHLSIIASIILVTMSAVGSSLRDISDFRKQLKEHIAVLLPETMPEEQIKKSLENVKDQIIKESNDTLVKHGFSALDKEVEALLAGQINELTDPSHKIRELTIERIRTFLKNSISNERSTRLQISGGLTCIEYELVALAKHFVHVVTYNLAVFGEFYDTILDSLKSESTT